MKFETTFVTIEMTPARGRSEFPVEMAQRGTVASAKVTCLEETSVYGVDIKITPAFGEAYVLVVAEGRIQDLGRMRHGRVNNEIRYSLNVPITWKRTPEGRVPHTRDREENRDNLDVIVMRADGEFVDIECALVTRWKEFFMEAQRVYQGQLVRTRDENHQPVMTTIPTAAIHAYPGASFEGIWSTVSDALIAKAKELNASQVKSRVAQYMAKWKPPASAQPVEDGWKLGVVDYFNALSGTGQIQGPGGKDDKYFVHFKAIQTMDGKVDEFPMLTPMSVVHFQEEPLAEGHDRPRACLVRPVKPIPTDEPSPTK